MNAFLFFLAALVLAPLCCILYALFISPRINPLRVIPSPPLRGLMGSHLGPVLDPARSPRTHEILAKEYGRSVRIRGLGPWDERFFTLDPLSLAHVMKNTAIYEKPWQSRRLITDLIGCGMLGAEGPTHRRQRRVATPAFNLSNLRALVPIAFKTGAQLRDKWLHLISEAEAACLVNVADSGSMTTEKRKSGLVVDVAMWTCRATFDIIGLAGFDYSFNSIEDQTNELFNAYKDMFETGVSQNKGMRAVLSIYIPIINYFFPNKVVHTVNRCQEVIRRVAGQLIQEKKKRVAEGEATGKAYDGRDLLSLLLKSNAAKDLPPEQRLSDDDILHNINTFLFAGSDTTSLALTWTFLLLAQHPEVQTRLRKELLAVTGDIPLGSTDNLTEEDLVSLHTVIADLPYLNNVCRESLRLISPVHSSLRVAMKDDVVPTAYPVLSRAKDGSLVDSGARSVFIPKGTFVHVPVEAFNLDKEFWGEDAWEFNPDRWDSLPGAVNQIQGLYNHLLTFSAGPRSCIGMRFSMIEMKIFIYILLTSFVFEDSGAKVIKANVALLRPYVAGKFKEGSQCPIRVIPYKPDDTQ